MAAKIQLPIRKEFRRWLLAGSFAAIATGVFFIILLVLPLVVFEGDFLNGSVAITWYSLKNYGKPVYHPGLASIPFLSLPALCVVVFNITVGFLTVFKAWRSRTINHVFVETLIGALASCLIFTSVFISLRLNVIHAVSVLPTEVSGAGSAGLLIVQGSARRETFISILIRQLYPLVFINMLLLILVVIIGYETARALKAS